MKNTKIYVSLLALGSSIALLSGCQIVKSLEKEINVVFMNEGAIVSNGTVTQFKNFKTPELDSRYIPTDFKFLGWTPYSMEQLDLSDPVHFKTQYIGAGRMVHYMEALPYVDNSTVVYNALIMHKDDVPKEYHYAVVAWYDKEATSGITTAQIETLEGMTKAYLASQNVSQEDIDTVVFRGYSGNVGPTTGAILFDGDVDVMLGWGSVNNITTTGSIPVEQIAESDEDFKVDYNGATKTRALHRISPSEGGKVVYDYLDSAEVKYFFHPEEE